MLTLPGVNKKGKIDIKIGIDGLWNVKKAKKILYVYTLANESG